MDSIKLDQSLEPKIMSTAALLESAALARDSNKDIEAITKKLFLKNLLTLPSSSTTALLAVSTPTLTLSPPKTPSIVTTTTENMITKEINDAQLNLTKILYQPDDKLETDKKDKDQDIFTLNGKITPIIDIQVDDDDRLVIDISDDEKNENSKKKKLKSLTPLLDDRITKFDSNQLPKSITYNLDTATSGIGSRVKIDILASNLTQQMETSATNMTKSPSKNLNISIIDELNILGHEIDRQMNRKTNEILEHIKAFLSNTLNNTEFYRRLNEIGNVTMTDITLITRKLIKRHKFEPNPNQHYFAKIKCLQFPTSGNDLVNYFANLLPTLDKEKFSNMIKFYEIIIKEMFNLNRTKVLQYLVDFMVKRKNSQLDLLNFNYLASTGVNIDKNRSMLEENQPSQSAQQSPSEKKPLKFFDTTYNFVVRSDPIYIMASSKFQTNIRNVIRCRSSSGIQLNSFERRPFDNNILRNRRIGKRLINEREDIKEMQIIPEKIRRPHEMKQNNFTSLKMQLAKIQNSSPILVSDTPPPSENSSPPPIPPSQPNNIEKPQIIQQFVLQQTISEKMKTQKAVKKMQNQKNDSQKFDFPKIHLETPAIEKPNLIKQHPKRRPSVKALEYEENKQIPVMITRQSVDNHITENELRTLTDNGTEIFPTSTVQKKIPCRRKTVDERAQIVKPSSSSAELKKIAPAPAMSEPIKPTAESAHRALMKRRQSCHERILANTALKTNETNLEQRYLNFLKTHFENNERENQIQQNMILQNQQQQHLLQEALHFSSKQVKFENPSHQNQLQIRPNPIHYVSPHQTTIMKHQMAQRAPKIFDLEHQKIIQEQIFRERFYDKVETLQDLERDQNTKLKVSSPNTSRVPQEICSRAGSAQKTPLMNDEKMMMVAYEQLQSLHDTSTFNLQQYTEHLKNIHLHKPNFILQSASRQNSSREGHFQNTQHQQVVTPTTAPHMPFYYPPPTIISNIGTQHNHHIPNVDQSLQKKLKLKSKTVTNYVEPNQGKPFYNPPHSTYYSDPYIPALKKTPPTVPTSLTAFHSPLHPQAVERRCTEVQIALPQQQNFWMMQQQQHNIQPNLPRPIPVQGTLAFADSTKIQNHAYQVQAMQHEQYQSDYFRHYYQQIQNPKSF